MGREFLILNKLNDGFPYCPKTYVHCTDPPVIGDEFYVIAPVEGIILRSDIPAELNFTAEKPKHSVKVLSINWWICTNSIIRPAV